MLKIGFHVEGPSDFAILRALVERLLGEPVEPLFRLRRARGIDQVRITLAPAAWDFHHHGCHAAVFHVDNNGNRIHAESHVVTEGVLEDPHCRRCGLEAQVPRLPERPILGPVRYAFAVPVQAIEAWLLCLDDRHHRHHREAESIDRKHAKRLAYGVETATLGSRRMAATATRSIQEGDVDRARRSCASLERFAIEVARFREANTA